MQVAAKAYSAYIALWLESEIITRLYIINMKRINRFLGFVKICFLLGMGLSVFGNRAFAQDVRMPEGSKVRYAIELKKFTQQEAADAVALGYVDLWVYGYFNQKFVDEGYIALNGNSISRINIRFAANTQGLQIIYKDGTPDLRADNDPGNCVAAFPGRAQQDAVEYGEDEESSIGSIALRDCSGSCTGGSLDGPSGNLTGTAARLLSKIETIDGETWYARALYKLRIAYKKPESFYVTHRIDNKPANSCGLAVSNFNIRPNASNNIYAPYPNECSEPGINWESWASGNPDWSMTNATNPAGKSCERIPDAFDVIMGGVEIEADPVVELLADK
ncbi:MAG: hypothetical protein NC048_09660, partial [Bacteroides sp.]|nr:hypothetical protein [Ruminococcus flavefaciens]MCM1555740.1 hypothetical protein [Bacteroides sp.]